MVTQMFWNRFQESTKNGCWFCFYTDHNGTVDNLYRAQMCLISLKYPEVKCLDVNLYDAITIGKLDPHKRRDVFIMLNGNEICRESQPDYNLMLSIFKTCQDKAKQISSNVPGKSLDIPHSSQSDPGPSISRKSIKSPSSYKETQSRARSQTNPFPTGVKTCTPWR